MGGGRALTLEIYITPLRQKKKGTERDPRRALVYARAIFVRNPHSLGRGGRGVRGDAYILDGKFRRFVFDAEGREKRVRHSTMQFMNGSI